MAEGYHHRGAPPSRWWATRALWKRVCVAQRQSSLPSVFDVRLGCGSGFMVQGRGWTFDRENVGYRRTLGGRTAFRCAFWGRRIQVRFSTKTISRSSFGNGRGC